MLLHADAERVLVDCLRACCNDITGMLGPNSTLLSIINDSSVVNLPLMLMQSYSEVLSKRSRPGQC